MLNQDENGVAASEAKLHFGELLNQCVYGKKKIIIKKHDKPVAVLVDYEAWSKKQAIEDGNSPLLNKIIKFREVYQKRIAGKKVKRGPSAVELIRQVRQERLNQLMNNLPSARKPKK